MRCKDCKYLIFEKGNGSPSRYYCKHEKACKKFMCGVVLICRCDRSSKEIKIKNSPKWCPLKEVNKNE